MERDKMLEYLQLSLAENKEEKKTNETHEKNMRKTSSMPFFSPIQCSPALIRNKYIIHTFIRDNLKHTTKPTRNRKQRKRHGVTTTFRKKCIQLWRARAFVYVYEYNDVVSSYTALHIC